MFKVEPWFEGCRTIILAGGPSVTAKAVHKIAKARLDLNSDIRVIAVNDAVYLAWWADWLHACDQKWWNWHINRVQHFTGIKTTLSTGVPEQWAGTLVETGKEGFEEDPSRIRHGSNGAYQALHCAIHAGSKDIGLLGVDLTDDGHWHEPHPMEVYVDRMTSMGPAFGTLLPVLKERGVKVSNLSRNSRLQTFQKQTLEDGLAERQYGERYDQIRADHIGRYEWAAGMVEGLVIDAACGCGYGAHYLADKAGVNVHAFDNSPDAIGFAMKHWSHPKVVYWMQELPDIVFEKADWVVSFETIEHLNEPERALERFRASAKNLLVSVPNENNIPFDPGRFPFHVKHYTPDQFTSLLEGAGWKVNQMLCQADGQTREPHDGNDGRTLIAACEHG